MTKAASKIFWGFLIATIHINIGPLTIFPPFIGMFLIAAGLGKMKACFPCKPLSAAHALSVILTLYDLILFAIDFFSGFGTLQSGSNYRVSLTLSVLSQGMQMAMFFLLFTAAAVYFTKRDAPLSARALRVSRNLYLGLTTVYLLYLALCINLPAEFAAAGVIAGCVLAFYCLWILFKLKRYFLRSEPTPPTPPDNPENSTTIETQSP